MWSKDCYFGAFPDQKSKSKWKNGTKIYFPGPQWAQIRGSSDLAWVSWLYFATKEKKFPFDKFETDSQQKKTLHCLDFHNKIYHIKNLRR